LIYSSQNPGSGTSSTATNGIENLSSFFEASGSEDSIQAFPI